MLTHITKWETMWAENEHKDEAGPHRWLFLPHMEEGEWLTILHLIQAQPLRKSWFGIEFMWMIPWLLHVYGAPTQTLYLFHSFIPHTEHVPNWAHHLLPQTVSPPGFLVKAPLPCCFICFVLFCFLSPNLIIILDSFFPYPHLISLPTLKDIKNPSTFLCTLAPTSVQTTILSPLKYYDAS